jgi:hypothetical protein
MKRVIIGLGVFLLAILTVAAAVTAAEKSQEAEAEPTATAESSNSGGHLEEGGKDIGNGYGHAGRELGVGTAGFGKNLVQGKFGEAGGSMGHGAAEFGKGVGTGTGRGFKKFGLAFRNLGKKIDDAVTD